MQLKYFVFSILCIITLNHCQPLFAHSPDLLDEIVELFRNSQEHPGDSQKLMEQIYELLNAGFSKENVINIVVKNKESEEFYARLNEEKRSYVLKIVVGVGIVVCMGYVVYRLLRSKKNQNDQFMPAVSNQDADLEKQRVALYETPQPTHNNSTSSAQEEHQQGKEVIDISEHCTGDLYAVNSKLREALTKSVEHARNIGLVPAAITFNDEEFANREPRGNRLFNEVIGQQLEYARRIGLVPGE